MTAVPDVPELRKLLARASRVVDDEDDNGLRQQSHDYALLLSAFLAAAPTLLDELEARRDQEQRIRALAAKWLALPDSTLAFAAPLVLAELEDGHE